MTKTEHLNMVTDANTRAKLEAYKTITGKTTTELFQGYLDDLFDTDPVAKTPLFNELYKVNLRKYGDKK